MPRPSPCPPSPRRIEVFRRSALQGSGNRRRGSIFCLTLTRSIFAGQIEVYSKKVLKQGLPDDGLWTPVTAFCSRGNHFVPTHDLGGNAVRLLNPGLESGNSLGGGCLRQEFADAFGELGADAGPIVNTIALEEDGGRARARIVSSDDLNGATVAGAVFFDDDDTVVGLFAGADAGETDHQHW